MSDERAALFDETLHDGPLPAPRDPEVLRSIAEQRFVHGLLRAAFAADAPSAEGRVLAALGAPGMPSPTAGPRTRRRLGRAIALVGLLAAVVATALWARSLWAPDASQILAAAVEGVLHEPSEYAVRGWRGWASPRAAPAFEVRGAVEPEGRFALTGTAGAAPVRMGYDGRRVWGLLGEQRFERSVSEAGAGEIVEGVPLCVADLELPDLLAALRRDAVRRALDFRAHADAGGEVLRAGAGGIGDVGGRDVAWVEIDVAPDSYRLRRLVVTSLQPIGVRTLELRPEPRAGAAPSFAPPW